MQAQGGYTKRAGRKRLGLGSRRVVWTSSAISIAIHLVLIGLYPIYGTLEPNDARLPFSDFVASSDALELLSLIELAQATDPERPAQPG